MNAIKGHRYLLFLSIFVSISATAQVNCLPWSSTRRLTVDDFGIKTADKQSELSFAQFSVNYSVGGFDFMTKNFNKKVTNCMMGSASWIDTTAYTQSSLLYQQSLFDITEIYVRHFRKELKENRKKIATGLEFVKELEQRIMTDRAKRQLEYTKATDFGSNIDAQQQWEKQIKQELEVLKEFADD
jgi:hypothetical protein